MSGVKMSRRYIISSDMSVFHLQLFSSSPATDHIFSNYERELTRLQKVGKLLSVVFFVDWTGSLLLKLRLVNKRILQNITG